MKAILIAKEYWMNSQLSVAKYTGGVTVTDKDGTHRRYVVVNSKGSTDWTHLDASEPADLIDADFIEYYKKLGRDKMIVLLDFNKLLSHSSLKDLLNREVEKLKAEKQAKAKKLKAERKAREERAKAQYLPLDFV